MEQRERGVDQRREADGLRPPGPAFERPEEPAAEGREGDEPEQEQVQPEPDQRCGVERPVVAARAGDLLGAKEADGPRASPGAGRPLAAAAAQLASASRAAVNRSTAKSRSAREWAADIWVRMRAAPRGTTG